MSMSPEQINELRVYALSMGQFLPLLERKKQIALHSLLQKYNAGEETLRAVATLNVLHEIESDIKGKLRTYDQIGKG